MRDDDRGVPRNSDIQLQRVHAHRERVGKGRQRILGKQRPSATMRLDVQSHNIQSHGLSVHQKTKGHRRAREATDGRLHWLPLGSIKMHAISIVCSAWNDSMLSVSIRTQIQQRIDGTDR